MVVMDDVMVITLFRHGLTEENKRQAYLGWNDSPLLPEEEEKLTRFHLTDRLVFSSDLGRCLTTAKSLFPSGYPEKVTEFRELHFGVWQGKTFEDLSGDPQYEQWLQDFCSVTPPEGESYKEFAKRVDCGWQKVRGSLHVHQQNRATIITHGGVIKYLLSQFAPEEKAFWDWKVPHGNGFELIWQKDGWKRGERCILLQEVPLMANLNG
ncbi:histidine phosphatase family protein [Mesobacillus maritimus]|uniref:histidine phosphatase family protein n=1 Tax=Mesobacillus maritimus TaxID=1643336 RepID=UPI00203AEF18|nr:histidine phosphatase family protein [Mesobacillus maritimus]MCM3584418.1 histidine phosphatase family protein [Mesobacillus maritimus]MCM3670849.1 histidine phosphatase family protein [Mesobacillus maritimus]